MEKIEVKYNVPIEVTEKQYNHARKHFGGIVAHREDEHGYYIKLMIARREYKEVVEKYLNE